MQGWDGLDSASGDVFDRLMKPACVTRGYRKGILLGGCLPLPAACQRRPSRDHELFCPTSHDVTRPRHGLHSRVESKLAKSNGVTNQKQQPL